MSKQKYLVQLLIEKSDLMTGDFTTAGIAEIIDEALAPYGMVKPVAMKVSRSASLKENPLAFMVAGSFIVQDEPIILLPSYENWSSRTWNHHD